MTNQEIFDNVLTHLRVQGVASVDDNGICMYRGPNGTSCAVGCLIPDELYDPEMEGAGLDSLPDLENSQSCGRAARALRATLLGVGIKWEQLPLLKGLQQLHDVKLIDGVDEMWEMGMERIADQFGLIYRRATP